MEVMRARTPLPAPEEFAPAPTAGKILSDGAQPTMRRDRIGSPLSAHVLQRSVSTRCC
jgi:hypothetical protein